MSALGIRATDSPEGHDADPSTGVEPSRAAGAGRAGQPRNARAWQPGCLHPAALAQMWSGGAGPTRSSLESALAAAGLEPDDYTGTKESVIRQAMSRAPDETAVDLAEELVDLLRTSGIFEGEHEWFAPRITRLPKAFADGGAELSRLGTVVWDDPCLNRDDPEVVSHSAAAPRVAAKPLESFEGHGVGFLTQALRRLPESIPASRDGSPARSRRPRRRHGGQCVA